VTSPAEPPNLADRFARPFLRFLELEASSALLLLAMAVAALVWANSPWGGSYELFWATPVGLRVGDVFAIELSLGHWVNDGLMTLFFFVVGMEIKRELVLGELSSPARAMLPIAAALGGMLVPAGVYAALHWGEPTLRGWGIPMATDIAFAVAALAAFGGRVPSGLRVFLLALAIADDLGAVAVIAVFYTEEIHLGALALAAGGLLSCVLLRWAGVNAVWVYALIGVFVWYETHHSGVHATIAGVLLGLLTPTGVPRPEADTLVARGRHALERLREILGGEDELHALDRGGHARHHVLRELSQVGRRSLSHLDFLVNLLERPVAFVVMPVFALANAGVRLDASTLGDPLAQGVALAVALGLVLGKPVGITLFGWAAVRAGVAVLPAGIGWGAIAGAGALAGIGFTVALFITVLAFEDPVAIAGAKVGILAGSVVATLAGVALLGRALPRTAMRGDGI
jgi:NhaA family Na+:H+ antiporter